MSLGLGFLNAGVQLGSAHMASKALNDTLNILTENPMMMAAVAGVVLVVLLH